MHELGVVVGVGKIVLLSDRQMANIKFWLEKDHLTDLSEELPQVAQTFCCIFKPNDYDFGYHVLSWRICSPAGLTF